MNSITNVTRKSILKSIKELNFSIYGEVDEVEFWLKFVDLESQGSGDYRFQNMANDLWQHRINNYDWPDDWYEGDLRVSIYSWDDEKFVDFLCETLNPLCLHKENEIQHLLDIYNKALKNDGLIIIEQDRISGRPIFGITKNGLKIEIPKVATISETFRNIEKRLNEADYSGAVTRAASLLGETISNAYKKISGQEIGESGELLKKYTRLEEVLLFSAKDHIDKNFKLILKNLVSSLWVLRHKMSDAHEHGPNSEIPTRNQAIFIVNSVKTVINFLDDACREIKSKQPIDLPF